MRRRRTSYLPRYREPICIDYEALANAFLSILIILLGTYLLVCPLLHTCGVKLDWWSWVYWLGEYIDSLR